MSHTPGPWDILRYRDDHGDVSYSFKDTSRYVSDDEFESNARLIAAAPELLEACRLITKFHGEIFPHGQPLMLDGKSINHTLLNEACARAQSAIRKAEGAQ